MALRPTLSDGLPLCGLSLLCLQALRLPFMSKSSKIHATEFERWHAVSGAKSPGNSLDQGLWSSKRRGGLWQSGNVLGAMNFKVGGGYWLRLPVFGWFTSKGQSLEANGVEPDVSIEISPDALAVGQDNQMARAIEIVNGL